MSWPVSRSNSRRSCKERCARSGLEDAELLQLCVLRLGLLQDGNVGIGVFPEGEKILICGAALCRVTLQRVGTCESDMRECSGHKVHHNAPVIKQLLELSRCGGAVVGC